MSKSKPLASSPLVAIAERASEAGGRHGVVIVLDEDANVCMFPTDETPPLLIAGMLVFALSLVTEGSANDDAEDE